MAANPNFVVSGRFWKSTQSSDLYNPASAGLVNGNANFSVNIGFSGSGSVQLLQVQPDGVTTSVVTTITQAGTYDYSISDANYRYRLYSQSQTGEIQYQIYANQQSDVMAAPDAAGIANAVARRAGIALGGGGTAGEVTLSGGGTSSQTATATGFAPGATVTFYNNGTSVGTATANIGGVATLALTGLGNGNIITASGLLSVGNASASVTTTAYLGQVATRSYLPNMQIPAGNANNQAQTRTRHTAMDNMSAAALVLVGWAVTTSQSSPVGTGQEISVGIDTTAKAWIEYPAGTFTPMTVSGDASFTIPNGGNVQTDLVTLAQAIPAGATFWVQTYRILSSTTSAGLTFTSVNLNPTPMVPADAANNEQFWGSTASSPLPGTPMTAPFSHAVTTGTYYPAAILGMTTKASYYLIGDSIDMGTYDVVDSTGNTGSLARSIGQTRAYINAGIPSDLAAYAVSNYTKRSALVQYCTHIICELGVNDFAKQSATSSALQANINTLRNMFPTKPFYQTTITPATNSTDSWATTANQTTFLGSSEAQRETFNGVVRAGSIGTGFFDVAAVVESSLNSGLWKVTGAADGYTTDGIHPNQAGYQLILNSGAITPPA